MRDKSVPVNTRKKQNGIAVPEPLPSSKAFWRSLPAVCGILGFIAGFMAEARIAAGAGDGAFSGFCLTLISSITGAVLGAMAKELRDLSAGKGRVARMVIASTVFLLLCGMLLSIRAGMIESVGKMQSISAETDLRNCRTNLDAYWGDYGRYPSALAEAKCGVSKYVVMNAVKITKKEYVVTAYHKDGNLEYMIRSGSRTVFFRKKGSGAEWVPKGTL